jgi:hypothetical protein
MKTGQFKNILVNDSLMPYDSGNLSRLLRSENLSELWNFHIKNPPGVYVLTYPEDMAVAVVSVTEVKDNGTARVTKQNYTVIAKYDSNDAERLLKLLLEQDIMVSKLKQYVLLHNQETPRQPLPKPEV